MDRLFLSALFALLAAFLTLVISFVKLVNDKEGKITDYREQWTNSAREALAKLISQITSLGHILEERAYRSERCNHFMDLLDGATSDYEKELLNDLLSYERTMLEKTNEVRRKLASEINYANTLARLHFKVNDPDFVAIENKLDSSLSLLRDIEADAVVGNLNSVKQIVGRVAILCTDVSTLSRIAIKIEWEKIKKGEPSYMRTKRGAKWGGVALLTFSLLLIAMHASFANKKMFAQVNQVVSEITAESSGNSTQLAPSGTPQINLTKPEKK